MTGITHYTSEGSISCGDITLISRTGISIWSRHTHKIVVNQYTLSTSVSRRSPLDSDIVEITRCFTAAIVCDW